MNRNDWSPWGPIQCVTRWADGIEFVSTASHGGFALSARRYYELTERLGPVALFLGNCLDHGRVWFEEDCDAQHVVRAFPRIFRRKPRSEY